MSKSRRQRLAKVEAALGAKVPDNLLAFLTEREPIDEGGFGFSVDEELLEIRTTFLLDGSGGNQQLDAVYARVGDVITPGALPFASDWAGNFFCLMVSGRRRGKVVYWDHERDEGDHSVRILASSLEKFISGLVTVDEDRT